MIDLRAQSQKNANTRLQNSSKRLSKSCNFIDESGATPDFSKSLTLKNRDRQTTINNGPRHATINYDDRQMAMNSGNRQATFNNRLRQTTNNSDFRQANTNNGFRQTAINNGGRNACRPPSILAPSIPVHSADVNIKNIVENSCKKAKQRPEGIIVTKESGLTEKRMARVEPLLRQDIAAVEEDPVYEEAVRLSSVVSSSVPSNKVKREDLEDYLNHVVRGPDLDMEFRKIPAGFNKEMRKAEMPCNYRKNRYRNNYPYDDTRVVLKELPDSPPGTDYINASYVSSYTKNNEFIASQGPKDFNTNTLGDFWRMIVENRCSVIVMIAKLTEGGRVKVSQYWPDLLEAPFLYGLVEVTLTSYKECLDYCIRSFSAKMAGQTLKVEQYQFLAWPDHEVPQSPHSFAQLSLTLQRIPRTGPMVVHCSAGIGRTGTLILVLSLMDQLDAAGLVDAPALLIRHRMCRARLIENAMQYRFAHELLLEMLFGQVTSYPMDQYEEKLTAMHKENPRILQDQYQKLKSLEKNFSYRWGENTVHQQFNRTQNILPVDGRQVFLQMVAGKGESQYINAVRVNSLRQRDAILVTEHPMRNTVHRVWRMAFEKKVEAWLLLQDPHKDTQGYPVLIGSGSKLQSAGSETREGNLFIRFDTQEDHVHFTVYIIMLTPAKASLQPPHVLKVLQLKGWPPGNALPTNSSSAAMREAFAYLDAIAEAAAAEKAAAAARLSGMMAPNMILAMTLKALKPAIMLTCSDGITGCGVAAALYIVRERIQLTGDVDVYRAVQGILHDRPQFIGHLEQYVFLHNASKEIIKDLKSNIDGTKATNTSNEFKENINEESPLKYASNNNKNVWPLENIKEKTNENKKDMHEKMRNNLEFNKENDARESSDDEITDCSSSSDDTLDEINYRKKIIFTHPKAKLCHSY